MLLNLLAMPEKGFSGFYRLLSTVYFIQSEFTIKNVQPNFTYDYVRGSNLPVPIPSKGKLQEDLKELILRGLVTEEFVVSGDSSEKLYRVTKAGVSQMSTFSIPPGAMGIMLFQVHQMHQFRKEHLMQLIYALAEISKYEINDPVPLLSSPR